MSIWRGFFVFASLGLGLALWITLRTIFVKITSLTASPLEASLFILAPTILLGFFLSIIAVNVLILRGAKNRYILYFLIALLYLPAHWVGLVNVLSVVGIFASLFVFEKVLLSELKNQVEPQLSRAVLGAGIISLVILVGTLSIFYYPIYRSNILSVLALESRGSVDTVINLGYFFLLQTFTTVGTYIAGGILLVLIPILHKAGVLKKERYHVEEWRYHR